MEHRLVPEQLSAAGGAGGRAVGHAPALSIHLSVHYFATALDMICEKNKFILSFLDMYLASSRWIWTVNIEKSVNCITENLVKSIAHIYIYEY